MIGLVVVWALGCVWATTARLALWRDEAALWADAVAQAPQKPRPWVNLGGQQIVAGQIPDAIVTLHRAQVLATDPRRDVSERTTAAAFAELNLAVALLRAHQDAGACRWVRHLIATYPTWPSPSLLEPTACAAGSRS